MIPTVSETLRNGFDYAEQPTRTHKLNIDSDIISGFTDEIEAMKQAIYLVLNVERYEYIIYSWNYGIELTDLFGQPTAYVLPEIKRRITEALMQDTRITAVTEFSFDINRGAVHVNFTVSTIYGDIAAESLVNI